LATFAKAVEQLEEAVTGVGEAELDAEEAKRERGRLEDELCARERDVEGLRVRSGELEGANARLKEMLGEAQSLVDSLGGANARLEERLGEVQGLSERAESRAVEEKAMRDEAESRYQDEVMRFKALEEQLRADNSKVRDEVMRLSQEVEREREGREGAEAKEVERGEELAAARRQVGDRATHAHAGKTVPHNLFRKLA
jgi:chromosome segregation ATPase